MIDDLKAFCIIYIVTLWVTFFIPNSKSIQNWKQKLIIWNASSTNEVFKLLFTYIYLSVASLSVLVKHKFLSLVKLRFLLYDVSI